MSDKRKKEKFANKRREKEKKAEWERREQLEKEGRWVNGAEVPVGAVVADHSQQVPNNSYTPPPDFYKDFDFRCIDCGSKEVWTAQQQKWYYEVAKGSLFAKAVRCRDCRNKLKDQGK